MGVLGPVRRYNLQQKIKRIRVRYPEIGRYISLADIPTYCVNGMELAIYTTYCGTTKNRTLQLVPVCSEIPHFFVSNNDDILCLALDLGYIPVYLRCPVTDDPCVSSFQAKVAKVIPHTIEPLSKYDLLFYKDDKFYVDTSRIGEYARILIETGSSLSVRPHNLFAGNLLYEFGAAMSYMRYRHEWDKTIAYITEELRMGSRLDCQMHLTGAILRNMRHPDTIKINELWWSHVQRCGIECQISFNIIAQKFASISLLPVDLA